MNLIHGFIQTTNFYDDTHFPHGFSRSGKFSISESEMLTKVGKRLWDLEQGLATPENQVEEKFLSVCQNTAEADTKVERLWMKYKDSIKAKNFYTLNSGSKVQTDENNDLGDDF